MLKQQIDKLIALLACAGLTAGAAHAQEADRIVVDGTAAYVNEHVITIGEVRALMAPREEHAFKTLRGEPLRAALRNLYREALDTLIERQLILDAFAERDVQLPDAAVTERVDEIIDDMFGGDRTKLLEALAKDQVSFEDWRERVREQMIVSAMRAANVVQNVSVPPARIRAAYEDRLETFREPAQVHLRMILLEGGTQGANRKHAETVRREIVEGRPFAEAARLVSDGGKAESGGDWGWIEPTKLLRPELAEAALALKAGEMSDIIELEGDFYILKAEAIRQAAVADFESVQEALTRELREGEAQRLYRNWIERLKQDAYVRIADVDVF